MTSPRRPRPTSPIRSNGLIWDGCISSAYVVFMILMAGYCLIDFMGDWNLLFERSLAEDDGMVASNPLLPLETSTSPPPSSSSLRPLATATEAQKASNQGGNWTEAEIVTYLNQHPQRNYFSHLFAHGGYRRGIEIGVQDGRFSEIFLEQNSKLLQDNWTWVLVDPNPTGYLNRRIGWANKEGTWGRKGYLENCNASLHKTISTDPTLLENYPDGYFDFVYLDASHTYQAVSAELPLWWPKLRSGGILAGHDYCNYGEPGQSCRGCQEVPQCQDYTGWGIESAKAKSGRSKNQNGVVRAVQDWLTQHEKESVSENRPLLTLRHTTEDFTRESLAKDGFDFELVRRRDRNPSWFIYKP